MYMYYNTCIIHFVHAHYIFRALEYVHDVYVYIHFLHIALSTINTSYMKSLGISVEMKTNFED